ncbi:hypothetical protein WG922_03095 [Ramlibacter sp. AN1015]|uniref:hypothetical protein n=1 Tax=Ramlibacter sp. AN1015 TaxID=3133428 RepID=UPI0030C31754
MSLHFLDFDYSEDDAGNGSFDAMAAADPARLPALQDEVLRVIAWAEDHFPGARGPLDAGGEWDWALEGVSEVATTLDLQVAAGRLLATARETGAPRVTLSFTLSGTPQFCAAFREAFDVS